MNRVAPTALIPALLVIAIVASGCPEGGATGGADGPSSETPTLRFSAIPDQNTTELQEKFDPVAAYLAETLAVPVEYVPSTDYQGSVEMFKNGDIHLAWFGGLTGVQARAAVEGAHAIAKGEEDAEFYSYFVAHRDSGLERSDAFPAGLAGLTFTFGSESSTSGRLMPEAFLLEHTGKAPKDFFEKQPGFSGSHDKTAELVESGQFQAGVLNYAVYEKRVAAGKTDPDVCRVIWKTPAYADYNFTAHPDLEELFGAGFTEKLAAALIGMTDEKLLGAFPRKRLIAATDAEFEGVRKVAESLGMVRAPK